MITKLMLAALVFVLLAVMVGWSGVVVPSQRYSLVAYYIAHGLVLCALLCVVGGILVEVFS